MRRGGAGRPRGAGGQQGERDMLDSRARWPPPTLSWHLSSLGKAAGPGRKHTEGKGRDWLTLAQSSTAGPGTGRGQEAAHLPPTLPVPLQGPDIQVVTSQPLQRAGRREGGQGRAGAGRGQTGRPWGGGRGQSGWTEGETQRERLVPTVWLPSACPPRTHKSPGPHPSSPSLAPGPGGLCPHSSSPASASWRPPPSQRATRSRCGA